MKKTIGEYLKCRDWTEGTWRGPVTWPRLQAEANWLGRIRVLSVDRRTGSLVVETIGRHQ